MTLAFPYVRYSSVGQADGSSAERQLALAQALADRHGLTLQPAIEDLGRSAATGANIQSGPLADFFARVHAGQVPRGSWLIVEDPDRISRGNPQTALNVLSQLVDAGLVIAYSRSGEIIQQGASWTNFLLTYINLGRANEENLRKQQLCRAGWKAAKQEAAQEGRALTRVCPNWLRIDSEGRYQPIPERVALIHRIYDEAITLGLGSQKIAQRLNAESIPMWQSVTMPSRLAKASWDESYVAKILAQRTVLGEYQPRLKNLDTGKQARADGPPIPDFYPQVVDLVTWQRAQAARQSRRGSGGARREAVGNLISGLAKCASCGASMTLRTGKKGNLVGRYGAPKGSYLICRNRLRGVCPDCCPKFSYPPVEDAIVDLLRSRLLGRRHYCDEQRNLELSIAQLTEQIEIDTQNAAALIKPGESLSAVRMRLLEEIESRVQAAEQTRSEISAKIAALVGTRDGDDLAREVEGIAHEMASPDLTVRERARTIAQAAIRSLLDGVQCQPDGLMVLRLGGGSAAITLREVDRVRKIAHMAIERPEGQVRIEADRAALWASRQQSYTGGLDHGFENQIARWLTGVDGVLTEEEIRRLDEGYVPPDPREVLRDAKRFLEEMRLSAAPFST